VNLKQKPISIPNHRNGGVKINSNGKTLLKMNPTIVFRDIIKNELYTCNDIDCIQGY
jgi:hypothetical protein